jgi:hypothetical protein
MTMIPMHCHPTDLFLIIGFPTIVVTTPILVDSNVGHV